MRAMVQGQRRLETAKHRRSSPLVSDAHRQGLTRLLHCAQGALVLKPGQCLRHIWFYQTKALTGKAIEPTAMQKMGGSMSNMQSDTARWQDMLAQHGAVAIVVESGYE